MTSEERAVERVHVADAQATHGRRDEGQHQATSHQPAEGHGALHVGQLGRERQRAKQILNKTEIEIMNLHKFLMRSIDTHTGINQQLFFDLQIEFIVRLLLLLFSLLNHDFHKFAIFTFFFVAAGLAKYFIVHSFL